MLSEYYQAATRAAALAEKDWFGIVKLTGTERVPWLQGMLTNDVEKLLSGSGCYAAHLTPKERLWPTCKCSWTMMRFGCAWSVQWFRSCLPHSTSCSSWKTCKCSTSRTIIRFLP